MNLTEWKGKDTLQNEIVSAKDPILVLMAAKWCGYCSRFIQQLRSLQDSENIDMILADADEPDESLWDMHRIRLVPTLLVFLQGKEIFRKDGRPGIGLKLSDFEETLSFLRSSAK